MLTKASKELFDNSDELGSMPESFASLRFDPTPVKSDDIMSIISPKVKRNLFDKTAELSGFCKDIDSCSISKKKPSLETECSVKERKIYITANLKEMVNKLADDSTLIADGSRTYVLPTISGSGKHQDLKSISPSVLAKVLNGSYNNVIESYRIIDCRYPYEFEGGHIRSAENLYLHEQILSILQQPTTGRQVLIFHCEFSSERGPKMLRFLRGKDRELNKENYPSLSYPEIYLLDGGFKAFYSQYSNLCDPVSYRPMLHSDYSSDLCHFRTKSKTWTKDEKRRFAKKAMRF